VWQKSRSLGKLLSDPAASRRWHVS
jgi:hypothetical protein